MTQPRTVRLARRPWHALRVPAGAIALGLATVIVAVAAGVGLAVPLAVAGGILAVAGAYLGVRQMSIRLDVEPGTVRLRGLGIDRRYHLERGDLRRVHTDAAGEAWLRSGRGLLLGFGVGRAVLAGGESVDLVRLAPGPALILIPTDKGRLGIVPSDEGELVAALTEAARAAPPPPPAVAPSVAPTAGMIVATAPSSELSGIDRAARDERLVGERGEAAAGAAAERATANLTAQIATIPEPAAAVGSPAVRRRRLPQSRSSAVPWSWTPAQLAAVVVPSVAALTTWIAARAMGGDGLPVGDLLAAVIAAGPLASLAAAMTIPRWPRLAGLTSVTAVAALLLVLRAAGGGAG